MLLADIFRNKLFLPVFLGLVIILLAWGVNLYEREMMTPGRVEEVVSHGKVAGEEAAVEDEVYQDPFVIYLREALDGYVAGTFDGASAGLESFDKNYYRGEFEVLTLNESLRGGKEITLVFPDKPDKFFKAWVYQPKEGSYGLGDFWQVEP